MAFPWITGCEGSKVNMATAGSAGGCTVQGDPAEVGGCSEPFQASSGFLFQVFIPSDIVFVGLPWTGTVRRKEKLLFFIRHGLGLWASTGIRQSWCIIPAPPQPELVSEPQWCHL